MFLPIFPYQLAISPRYVSFYHILLENTKPSFPDPKPGISEFRFLYI